MTRPGLQELERVRAEARAEARRARDAGEPYSGEALAKKFGKSAVWGRERLVELKIEGGVSRLPLQQQEVQRVRDEARRARDAGEPYTAVTLGEKFGRSGEWGRRQLAHLRDEGATSRSVLDEQAREAARVEARRARDAGEPHTAATLAEKFGKSWSWGRRQLARIQDGSDASQTVSQEQEKERLREEARAEARRARDAGEPHSNATLGKKFGKSKDWGRTRLAEINSESGVDRLVMRAEERAQEHAAARAEARRARDAGEPHSGESLAKAFGKGAAWGWQRLREIRNEGGLTLSERHGRERAQGLEEVRAEARRARDADEPYTAETLGKKFGRSRGWGRARLAENSARWLVLPMLPRILRVACRRGTSGRWM